MTWERLGREMARWRVRDVHTRREVVGRGRSEDLMAIWGKTEVSWVGGGAVIMKEKGR